MALQGPILLIEDDQNDTDVVKAAVKDLGIPNQTVYFPNAAEAHAYLLKTQDKPLIILCDIRMSALDGLSLLKQIQANPFLRTKAIPFIFLTGLASQEIVDEAFNIGIQGFYVKPASYVALKDMIRTIVTYWIGSKHPSGRYEAVRRDKQAEAC